MASDLREQSTEVAAEVESTEKVMKIKVCKWGTERTVVLSVTEEQLKTMTVLQLKEKIESGFGFPVRDQDLWIRTLFHSHRYTWLKDNWLLSDYGITDGSTIHLSKVKWSGWSGWSGGGMGDRDGRNRSMELWDLMFTRSDVSSESAPHPQPAAVEDLHKDSC